MNIKILHMVEGAKEATGIVIIIDVFRAFTVEPYLIYNGVEKLIPVGDKKIAYNYKEKIKDCILVGERYGKVLPGFDYGNSPSQIKNIDFTGKTVLHTTSCGTQGIVNAKKAQEILTGSFVNAKAISKYIKQKNTKEVSLVCMSDKYEKNEDKVCANYIKSLLEGNYINVEKEIENLKETSGAKFFDKLQQEVFPEDDFYLCTEINKFNFVLKVIKLPDGLNCIQKIEIN